jgi:acyl-[acyl-carrier-protein]-phospholipid O-acyltransferase/long-chain-fatty-acid--[acyl-carrier-protein] ligase
MAQANAFPRADQAVPDRAQPELRPGWSSLTSAFVRAARANKDKVFGIDATGSTTYGDLLERSIAASRVIGRRIGSAQNVGVLIPPSVGGALANVAVTVLGKTAVNLSYAIKADAINAHIRKAKITHVVTSRAAMEKLKITGLNAQLIYLEDIKDQVTGADKAFTGLVARYVPLALLHVFLAGARRSQEDTATVMFTSGSTGDPKGVVLSHGNILSNIASVTAHTDIIEDEIILGVLPFFHSFGFTVTLWTALTLGKTVVYYPNPLDVRAIAELIEKHKITLMASTPTLMRGYLKRATKEQFASVRMLLLGSEKLKAELATDIQSVLGIIPVEAYGATECSPGISANVPRNVRTPDGRTVFGNKIGSVGQPMPGTTILIVDVNTRQPVARGQEGLILVHGAQVMQGYLEMPEQTAEVLRNGWYCTGDVGYIDADGFLWITDRLTRFAKVAGEMVPLIKVEKALLAITGTNELTLSVTAIPDAARGERVAVVYTPEMGMTPSEATTALSKTELPALWLPRTNDFVQVEKLPTGPTGKLDLKEVKNLALAKLQ